MDLREAQLGALRRHPWEQARARALARLLEGSAIRSRPTILDIGCGDGWALHTLGERLGARRRVGVDPALEQRPPSTAWLENVETHARLAAVQDERFDLVLLLDVLEHVDDDRALLAQAATLLADGGRLLVTVPAFPALWSAHDEFLRHHRRYRRSALLGLAPRAGLAVERSGSLFGTLLVPRLVSVAAQRAGLSTSRPTGVGAWRGGPRLTWTLSRLLQADNRGLLRLADAGLLLPGLTAWMLCRRA